MKLSHQDTKALSFQLRHIKNEVFPFVSWSLSGNQEIICLKMVSPFFNKNSYNNYEPFL